jgi:ferredoxin
MDRLYAQLCRYDPAAWRAALSTLSPSIHEIDRTATRIWLAFFPLELHQILDSAEFDGDKVRRLGLMGRWRLSDQVDSSHRFLYAHRYWPQVKAAISADQTWPEGLPAIVTAVAGAASRTARVDPEMLLGISAAGLMTLRQAGPGAFAAAPGKIHLTDEARRLTPHQVMRRRAKQTSQGLFGFTRGLKKRWKVTFDESDPAAKFVVITGQELATAAQSDKRDYRSRDLRCTPGEGPIPVECRAASCGTCWVGVLAGAEKLSPIVDRDEGRPMRVFGYVDGTETTPVVRLACQARASGAVTIVIPPWNGTFGKHRQKAEG